jgi:hypothetical protein
MHIKNSVALLEGCNRLAFRKYKFSNATADVVFIDRDFNELGAAAGSLS